MVEKMNYRFRPKPAPDNSIINWLKFFQSVGNLIYQANNIRSRNVPGRTFFPIHIGISLFCLDVSAIYQKCFN